jgi:hypothetical protein
MLDLNLIKEEEYDSWVITTNHHQLDVRFYALSRWRFNFDWGYDYYSNTLFLGCLSIVTKCNAREIYLPSLKIELTQFGMCDN